MWSVEISSSLRRLLPAVREELIKPETRRALWRVHVYTDTDLVLSAFAVTVQVSTLMFVRKIGTVFVHHGYPHNPLTHQLSYRICTDLKIDPGEGGGATAPICPPPWRRYWCTVCTVNPWLQILVDTLLVWSPGSLMCNVELCNECIM